MEESAWKERLVTVGGVIFAVLLLFAMAAIPRAIDAVKGDNPETCSYTSSEGSYRAPCPEELPSGSDGAP